MRPFPQALVQPAEKQGFLIYAVIKESLLYSSPPLPPAALESRRGQVESPKGQAGERLVRESAPGALPGHSRVRRGGVVCFANAGAAGGGSPCPTWLLHLVKNPIYRP